MSSDTSQELARMVAERFNDMSGQERFMIGVEMFETARTLVLASLPQDATEDQRRQHLVERFYPELSKQPNIWGLSESPNCDDVPVTAIGADV